MNWVFKKDLLRRGSKTRSRLSLLIAHEFPGRSSRQSTTDPIRPFTPALRRVFLRTGESPSYPERQGKHDFFANRERSGYRKVHPASRTDRQHTFRGYTCHADGFL